MHRKILTIFGTRPEAVKLFPLLHALADSKDFESLTCVTAQHRGLLDQVLEVTNIRPQYDLDIMQSGQPLDALTAKLLISIGTVLDEVKPSRIIVQGDTVTAMAAALAAYYRKIPVAHVEAGLRSNDIYHPWPEEVNRKFIANIADLHFAPTQNAARALLGEGIDKKSVFVTGNTCIDALLWVKKQIEAQPDLVSGLDEIVARFAGKHIIAVTCHRRENFGDGLMNIAAALADIAARKDVAIIFPIHPNPHVRAIMDEALSGNDSIAAIAPLDYPHFVHLLSLADIILTDSGGVQEEAPALGKPVLVMRKTTERPEGVEAGTARLVGTDRAAIVSETFRLLDDQNAYAAMRKAHSPYGDGKSAARIADIIRLHTARTEVNP